MVNVFSGKLSSTALHEEDRKCWSKRKPLFDSPDDTVL